VGFAEDGRSIAWGQDVRVTRKPDGQLKGGELSRRLRLPSNGHPMGAIENLGPGHGSYILGSRQHGPYLVKLQRTGPGSLNPRVAEISKDGQVETKVDLGSENRTDGPFAFSPDGQVLFVAGVPYIKAYDLSGRLLGELDGHVAEVRDLAPSPDGRFLVSGSDDQTVRLWNLKTHELVVSLYDGSDGEWVMWTPQGYYTGSPGADKIVGWQINKGPEQTPDYVGADQLRQHLHRPDIVEKAIVLASAEQAVRQAPGTSLKLADLLARPVPRFAIVRQQAGSPERSGRASVRIAINATPDPVKLIRVQVNGRQVMEETPPVGSGGFGAGERALDVPLAKGRNEVRIALTNVVGESVKTLELTHESDGDLDTRGTLHILAIGVNEYKGLGNTCGGGACDLRYSVADARRLAEAVEQRLGPGHARVVKRVLVNGGDAGDAPTAANITDAVELLRQARETDTVVLFIAGHGVNEGPDYRFLPTDAQRTGAGVAGSALRGSTVVPWQVLQSAVEAAKGRRLLFVDTCHSGNAYNQRLGNAAYHANIIAYTAARFDQEAMEDPGLGHGLFTYAVVEGLDGKGDMGVNRRISTRDLAGYVVRRVGELARVLKGEQEPQYFKGRDADDYVLAQW
jgi:caspase domain-containing protein/WD40 domain-containing protein